MKGIRVKKEDSRRTSLTKAMDNEAEREQSSWRNMFVSGEIKCQRLEQGRGDCSSAGWLGPGEQQWGYGECLTG